MTEITYREYRPEDAESFVRLHDSAFPAIPAGYWPRWSASAPVTAAVAILDGAVVGTVPFHFRDFLVRPGVAVRVACEFSVCVREDLRDRGVGSGLMRAAKQFLRGRCQVMMVHREDERSAAYRYYARNGHHDVAYLRPWARRGEAGVAASGVETIDRGHCYWQRHCRTRGGSLRSRSQPAFYHSCGDGE